MTAPSSHSVTQLLLAWRHRDTRLATGEGLVGSRTEETRIECRWNGRNRLSSSITRRESAIRMSAPRFSSKLVPAIVHCDGKWNRCWRKTAACGASWKDQRWSLLRECLEETRLNP